MSIHRFDSDIAMKVGVNAAVIYENLRHWMAKNKANNKHFHENKTWTYNSYSAFCVLFPYLSKEQIKGAIKKLTEKGLIEKGNFNAKGYDRTTWYHVIENKHNLISPHHEVKINNGWGENPPPIPDIKPYNKPNTTNARDAKYYSEVKRAWNDMAKAHGIPECRIMTPDRARMIDLRVAEYGGDEALVYDMIANIPLNDHWTGKNGKGFHARFDWVFKDPVRFRQALEAKPTPAPKEYKNGKSNNTVQSGIQRAGEIRRAAGIEALKINKARLLAKGIQ